MRHRTSYGTFTLRCDKDGVVHLDSDLPEVVAVGHEVLKAFMRGEPPGGPHAELRMPTIDRDAEIHVTTPEATFTYLRYALGLDSEGHYHLMRLTYTDATYHAFLAGH